MFSALSTRKTSKIFSKSARCLQGCLTKYVHSTGFYQTIYQRQENIPLNNVTKTCVSMKSSVVNNKDLQFEDFERAFLAKSTPEIVRALIVYKLCSYNVLVDNNKAVSIIYMSIPLSSNSIDFWNPWLISWIVSSVGRVITLHGQLGCWLKFHLIHSFFFWLNSCINYETSHFEIWYQLKILSKYHFQSSSH